MANTNQNQNLNKLLDQSLQKKSAMEQGSPQGGAQMPTMNKPPKSKSGGSGGLLIKIIMGVLFVLIMGLGVFGYMMIADLDSKNTTQDITITDNQEQINAIIARVDTIEGELSGIDTYTQKVDAIENTLDNYVTQEELEPVVLFLRKQDSDQEGLSDYDEIVIYRSNPNKKDTDNDGFNDKEEVDNGFNPAGPGRLGEQDLSEDALDVIVGDWAGNLTSEVIRSSEFTMKLSNDNKVTGKLVFPGAEPGLTYESSVGGTYSFNESNGKFNVLLTNYFSVIDKNVTQERQAVINEYKMNIEGTFSNETKQINGTWQIDGDVPPNWPAGDRGSFTLNKSIVQESDVLQEDTTTNGDEIIPIQEYSVKAFSFGYSPSTIRLTQGQRISLEVTSLDVAHTFTIDELDINIKVDGGETKSIDFAPDIVGEYTYYCSVEGHQEAGMQGKLIVEEAAK